MVMDRQKLAECSSDDLGNAIAQLHALQMATMASMLEVIAEFARRQAWKEDGCCSMTDWLVAKLGVARSTAADLAKIAVRLEELPIMAGVVADGGLSFDKLKAASELATPETDGDATETALSSSTAFLQLLVRRARRVSADDDHERRRQKQMWWRWDKDAGILAFGGRLPDVAGATVVRAIERMAEQTKTDAVRGDYPPLAERYADALVALAGQRIAADPAPDRATVVVHADAETMDGELENGVQVSTNTVERLLCNARVQLVFDGRDGKPVGVGRMMRIPPPWLERLVLRRDGHQCRFPGCSHTKFLQIHHIRWWEDGGRSDASNLAAICTHHHPKIHAEDWKIDGDANGTLVFSRNGHRLFESRPPRLRADIRKRTLDRLSENYDDTG